MRELSLEETKLLELELLKEFSGFCKKNDIRFFLAYGTLLGAIRYKGFIPWDDDVDVLVPREDYDKFIRGYQDGEVFHLYSIERNNNFGYPFAKLCNMRTRKEEGNIDNGVNQGVEIDIFPLDYWNNNIEKAKAEVKRLKRNMYWLNIAKISHPRARSPFRLFVLKHMIALAKHIGTKHYIDKIIKISCKANQKNSVFMGDKVWCPYGERDICSADVFANSVEVQFEGDLYPAPQGYDEYLTRLYGDYLPEPPKEKQKTHHVFKAYLLDEEDIKENTL